MKALYTSREPVGPVRLARRPIIDVMSRPAVTVSAGALLDDALTLMVQKGVRHLVVVDAEGRCLGVLSDRAIAAAWAIDYAALSHRVVATVMDLEPAIVSVRDHVVEAARLMRAAGTDAVAVADDHGRAVGVVTGNDLVSLLAQ